MTDHYRTLGVDRNANPDDIKKAYRKLAAQHHPDRGGDTAMFQKIQEAYDILSDPQKKREYDNPNPFSRMQGQPGGFSFDFGGPGGFQFNSGGININDLFGGMFGGGPRGNPFGNFQQTYQTTIFVTLEQVYNGGEETLQLQSQNGIQAIKIKIPKGIDNGKMVRLENVIPNGILMVEFRIHPHNIYNRIGQDLQAFHKINVLDLITGTEIDFRCIDGKTYKVKVPPGTQPDATLRIQGKGLPYTDQQGYGDQLILLKSYLPDIIDNRITDSILQSRVR